MSQENLNFKVVRIHKLSTNGKMKAFVDVNINDALIIRGLRVVLGSKGLFVSMPQEKGKDNKWYDTIRCLSKEVRSDISNCILEVYNSEKK